MEPFLGQIVMFGGNFAPRGWAFCDGQLLAISSNTALFSILGTTYGGDGRTTFGLPDMRARSPMGEGNGPGIGTKALGQKGGQESTTLAVNNLPPHNHSVELIAEGNVGNTANPTNAMLSVSTNGDKVYGPDTAAAEVAMNPKSIKQQSVGSGQSFSNESPYSVVNFIIALQGVFPSRS
ncbi:phage tail protein [Fretibacter rubidus]|uniref:phage tail protein n=1 Tax=Fretibacter rubidus TaxID=570162 RepID=UPI00352A65A1